MKNKVNLSLLSVLLLSASLAFQSCKKDDDCKAASTAKAGDDQNVVGTSTTLAANVSESGIGSWTIVSGDGGTLADPLNPTTTFTGTIGTTYLLKWTITGCPSSEDEVSVNFICNPNAAANAGPDQVVVGTSTTLAATGSGTWSLVSGAGGTIGNPTSATSTFSGTVGTTYVLRWTVACPATQDDVQISFNDGLPKITAIDKATAINGEMITVTGINFTSNMNGVSQVSIVKTTDPYINQETFLTTLSRTATEIKVVIQGANGGAPGTYSVRYNKKPDANPLVQFSTNFIMTIAAPAASQIYTSSTFTNNNVAKGAEASFGVKNGSLVASDYSIKLIKYDYTTGVSSETDATVTGIIAGGYGGSMDKLSFTAPANAASASYYVKVTYAGKSVLAGWGSIFNVN
jgi:hypothetical protein